MPMEDARPKKNGGAKKSAGASGTISGLRAYNPTKEDKERLREVEVPLADCLATIAGKISEGCSLSIKYREDSKAYWAILRVEAVDWKAAPAVSVWNQDLERVIVGLWYYLTQVDPEWPESVRAVQLDFNW